MGTIKIQDTAQSFYKIKARMEDEDDTTQGHITLRIADVVISLQSSFIFRTGLMPWVYSSLSGQYECARNHRREERIAYL